MNLKKMTSLEDDIKEEPVPFLIYDSNTKSKFNQIKKYSIHLNRTRRRSNKIL
jgi:hypothetical protein